MDQAALIIERLAVLTAEVAQVRTTLQMLVDASAETNAGLAALDKSSAVSEARADLRALDLAEVRRRVDVMSEELDDLRGPVKTYFEARNKAQETADANKANVWSYVTRERIALLLAVLGGIAAWFRPDMALSVTSRATPITETAPPSVQFEGDAGTVDE